MRSRMSAPEKSSPRRRPSSSGTARSGMREEDLGSRHRMPGESRSGLFFSRRYLWAGLVRHHQGEGASLLYLFIMLLSCFERCAARMIHPAQGCHVKGQAVDSTPRDGFFAGAWARPKHSPVNSALCAAWLPSREALWIILILIIDQNACFSHFQP